MQTERRKLIDELRRKLDPRFRHIDCAARLNVWQRGNDGNAVPGRSLTTVYGGRYDNLLRRLVADAETVCELPCHQGQLPLLLHDDPSIFRVLALGAPGGGKSEGIVLRIILNALARPGTVHGIVAPASPRLVVLWKKAVRTLKANGWYRTERRREGELELRNGSMIEFVSAKEASGSLGNAVQGRDWESAGEDEQQNIREDVLQEVDGRGRNNPHYQIFSTATNQPIAEFQARLDMYEESQVHDVVQFDADANVFIFAGNYARLKALWSREDYERKVELKRLPPTDAIYPMFDRRENQREIPTNRVPVTAQIIADMFPGAPRKARYIVATDFGSLTTASVVLEAYPSSIRGRVDWYAIDEITSRSKTPEQHGLAIAQTYSPQDVVIIGDTWTQPDGRTDKSDYDALRRMGLTMFRASGKRISRRHRFSMVNALLCNGYGDRRLFCCWDSDRRSLVPQLVKSLTTMRYGPDGNPQVYGKGTRDMSHWADALGVGVFRWERILGSDHDTLPTGNDPECLRCGHKKSEHTVLGCRKCDCSGFISSEIATWAPGRS